MYKILFSRILCIVTQEKTNQHQQELDALKQTLIGL